VDPPEKYADGRERIFFDLFDVNMMMFRNFASNASEKDASTSSFFFFFFIKLTSIESCQGIKRDRREQVFYESTGYVNLRRHETRRFSHVILSHEGR